MAAAVMDLLTEHCNFQVDIGEEGRTVRGVLDENAFLDWGCYLAEIFRAASAFGGDGELWFLEEQTMWGPQLPELCYRLTIDDDQAHLTHPTRAKQQQILTTPEFTDLVTSALLGDELPRGPQLTDLLFERIASVARTSWRRRRARSSLGDCG
ncbi:hypothetical protein [Streptomyces sp. NPDC056661]|uniref:hypothetical protein n=1 Tax=Streptomyces sp. NPDC056661 TaxID=3345898 RepID=UPI0036AF022C